MSAHKRPRRRKPAKPSPVLPGLEDFQPEPEPWLEEAQEDPDEERPRLPAVRIPGRAALVADALAAPLLRSLEALARRGVGAELTRSGLLRAKDAHAAADDLGIQVGPASSPASPVQQLWRVAEAAELVVVARGSRSRAAEGPGLRLLDRAARGEADEEGVLQVWLELFAVFAENPVSMASVLTLYLGYPDAVSDLASEVEDSPFWLAFLPAPSSPFAHYDIAGMVDDSVADLELAGAVQRVGEQVRLTGLGAFGASRVLSAGGFAAPAVGEDVGEADAAALVDLVLATEGEATQQELVAEWLASRDTAAAAHDLVAVAAGGDPVTRVTAFSLLLGIDDRQAEPAVRAALDDPSVVHYATAWLLTHGLDGPRPTEEMAVWLSIDAIAAALEVSAGDEEAVRDAIAGHLSAVGPESEQVRIVHLLADSDHPQAGEVLEAVRTMHPSRRVSRAARRARPRVAAAPAPPPVELA